MMFVCPSSMELLVMSLFFVCSNMRLPNLRMGICFVDREEWGRRWWRRGWRGHY